MVMETLSPQCVGREFVRQYYTLLNQAPAHLHRFYNNNSWFIHGGLDPPNRETTLVVGQKQIHQKIQQLNFRDCHAKITQVDSQATLGEGVVVQVTGELSNSGQPMRRFTQTFVLAFQAPKKYYVHNDIFRYQDMLTEEEYEEMTRNQAEEDHQAMHHQNTTSHHTKSTSQGEEERDDWSAQPMMNGTSDSHHHDTTPAEMPTQPANPPPPMMPPTPAVAAVVPPMMGPPTAVVPPMMSPPTAVVQPMMTPPPAAIQPVMPPAAVAAPPPKMQPQPVAVQAMIPPAAAPSPAGVQPMMQQPEVPHHQPQERVSSPNTLNLHRQPWEPQKMEGEESSGGGFGGAPGGESEPPAASPPNSPGETTATEVKTYANLVKGSSGTSSAGQIHSAPPPTSFYSPPVSSHPISSPMGGSGGGLGGRERSDRGRPPRDNRLYIRNDDSLNQEYSSGGGDMDKGRKMHYSDSQQLFMGNLPHDATEPKLREIFSKFGNIVDMRVLSKPGLKPGSRPPNYGFIIFENPASVQAVLNSKPIIYPDGQGTKLNVEEKKIKGSVVGGGGGGSGPVGGRGGRTAAGGGRPLPGSGPPRGGPSKSLPPSSALPQRQNFRR